MSELLSKAQSELDKVVSEEPIFRILRATYPGAIIKLQPTKATYVELEGRNPILISDLEGGLWEGVHYLDALLAESNYEALPTTHTVRIISAPCESVSGPSLLLVGLKDLHFIFDDVDSWFLERCAGMISQMFRKRLLFDALRAKERFLRGFSHQLRTPIHGILGSADLLAEELQSWYSGEDTFPAPVSLEKPPKMSVEEHAKYLNIIKMGGRDLVAIINNMITLNRWADIAMTDRHYAMHPVEKLEAEPCSGILNLTVGDLRYKSSVFFTHVLPSNCESFWMDIDVLRDSLLPLIFNAVQHTPDGIISVTSSLNLDMKQLTVDIEDNGRGIHQNDQRRIFEPYEKVDLHSARAGLGLTLASRFATLLHGSVALISSSVGRGSHFRATFRDVECTTSPQAAQALASKRRNLPSKFYSLVSELGPLSLIGHFANFLTRNGFAQSDSVEDSFVILDAALNPGQHRLQLSQIPSDVVAICLLPGLDAEWPFERTAKNVIYASGPFSTPVLRAILEQAESLLLEIKTAGPPISQSDVVLPLLPKKETTHGPDQQSSSATTTSGIAEGIAEVRTPTPRLPSASPRPTTLIVDDNAVNLRVMEMYCKKRGLPYMTAKDGRQAVEIFTQRQSSCTANDEPAIELIFMDLQMPGKSLVLVMSGQDTLADKTAAREAGGDEYFVKPVVIQQLDRVIKRHFPMFEVGRKR
ncbi:hypothetical protein BJX70DRAFT_389433 [Aspergillus crustosus]